MVHVNANALEDAMTLADAPDSEAWVCRATGKVIIRSDLIHEDEPIPEDVDDYDKYVTVPGLKRLDLGQALVFSFVLEQMPDEERDVRHMFRRPGAYRRFSKFVDERDLTDRWHAFRDERTQAALRDWCESKGLQLAS